MEADLLAAKKMLDKGYTVVICYKGMIFTSNKEKDVALKEFISSKLDLSMFSIALKSLENNDINYLLELGINKVITYKLSSDAKELLDSNNFIYNYFELI